MKRVSCFAFVVALLSGCAAPAEEQGPPLKRFANSIEMEFVWIPPGTFMMGSPEDEEDRFPDRETHHKVTLTKGFYMGVHPVTQEQWQGVMGNNPSRFKHEENLPVEQVSWTECQEFARRVRESDKKPYRLPTEAEWEYACRAGITTAFHFGETMSTDQANCNGETFALGCRWGTYRKKTTPVGSFPANAFGLHDMHGNVRQFCEDWYGDYSREHKIDPKGVEKGKTRVTRGGCWCFPAKHGRSASRSAAEPGYRHSSIGCRLCFFDE